MLKLALLDALSGYKSSIRSLKVNQSRGGAVHFDGTVFAGDLGIVEHDIGTRSAQYHASLAQTKNLSPRRALDDCHRHGLVCRELRDFRRSVEDETGITLFASALQPGFARELFLVHGVARTTMGAFNVHSNSGAVRGMLTRCCGSGPLCAGNAINSANIRDSRSDD